MASLLQTLRNSILDSIKGRKFGLDKDEYIVGPLAFKPQVLDLSSASTATAIPPYGITHLLLTTAATSAAGGGFIMSAPVPGVSVKIVNDYTSTGALGSTAATILRASNAFSFQSSEGTTMTTIVLSSQGFVELTAISSAIYQITSRSLTTMAAANGTT